MPGFGLVVVLALELAWQLRSPPGQTTSQTTSQRRVKKAGFGDLALELARQLRSPAKEKAGRPVESASAMEKAGCPGEGAIARETGTRSKSGWQRCCRGRACQELSNRGRTSKEKFWENFPVGARGRPHRYHALVSLDWKWKRIDDEGCDEGCPEASRLHQGSFPQLESVSSSSHCDENFG